MMGGGGKDEQHLALLPLPPVLLFAALVFLNDRPYLTASQQVSGIVLTVVLCTGIYSLLRVLLRRSPALKRLLRTHGPYILVFLLLLLVKFRGTVSGHLIRFTDPECFADYLFMKYSVTKYHQLPLWNPYVWSGFPGYAVADKLYYFPLMLPFSFLPTMLAMDLIPLVILAIGGVLMYGLVVHLSKSEQAGLVSALVFVFCAYTMDKASWHFFMHYFPVMLIPAIFFSLLMLTAQKRFWGFLRWGAAAGLLLGLQILSGTPEHFIYTSYFIMVPYLAVSFLTSPRLRKALPSFAIALIVLVALTSGVSAVKMLPSFKFMEITNRAGKWTGEASAPPLPHGESWLNVFKFLARSSLTQLAAFDPSEGIYSNEEVGELGLVGFLLALAALSKINKRPVLTFFIAFMVVVIIVLYPPFYLLLQNTLPLFNRVHVPTRTMSVFIFSGAALAGIGWTVISKRIPKEWLKKAFIVLVSLMILDLIILGHPLGADSHETQPFLERLEENQVIQSLAEREGLFRIAFFQVKGIDSAPIEVTVPVEIQYNQGYDGIVWMSDYWQYLGISYTTLSRFWGMQNIKYAVSSELVDEPGFVLEQTFEECEACTYYADHYDGPYLYLNTEVLPRAYIVDNAILVTGDWDAAENIAYGLLAHSAFNSRTTAIIHDSRSLSDVPKDELLAYRAIIPVGELSNSGLDTLREMKDAGVKIVPNIFAGENQITAEHIEMLFQGPGENSIPIQEVDIPLYTPNKIVVGPVTGGTFLILTEKYSLFPGEWKVSVEGRSTPELLRANAMATAIPLADVQGKTMTFRYLPPLFVIGASLSTIGLLSGIILIWQPWNKLMKGKKEEKDRGGIA